MQPKFLHGLLTLSGVGLLLFLITKITKGSSLTGRVANVPDPVQKAFNKVFDNSPYRSLKDNWLAVSKMETAAWTSNLYKNYFNLWGMKVPKVRHNVVAGQVASGNNFWARYNSLDDAVKDITLWMDYTKFPYTASLDEQLKAMKDRGYFQESLDAYSKLVKAWQAR
jgi:hypothetical protein